MSRADKLLEQMRGNPRDWRIDDVKTVAAHFAVDWRNMGGSHHIFGVPGIAEKVCVPSTQTDQASVYPAVCGID